MIVNGKLVNLKPEQRLIVGFDFKPDPSKGQGREWVREQVLTLSDEIAGIGCVAKVNSALRSYGYDLIDVLHSRGLEVMADLKLYDIGDTLSTDGVILREMKPEIVTVACTAGKTAMRALKLELPDTEVLGISVLTSLNEEDTKAMFVCGIDEAVLRLSHMAAKLDDTGFKLDGLVSSGKEVAKVRAEFGTLMTLNTPAIRPAWAEVKGDGQNQKRVMTPFEAIKAGADRIVVARPIIQAANRYDAVMRTIEEIALAA